MKFEVVLDYKLVAVAHVIGAVDPAKLHPVPVCDQDAAGRQIVGRQLSEDPVLYLQTAILNRMQVFVARAKNKVVLLFGVNVLPVRLQDGFHATIEQESSPPPLKREIHPVLELSPGLDSSAR